MDSCLMCHCETGVLVMQDATCIDSTVSQFTPVSSSIPSMLTNHSSNVDMNTLLCTNTGVVFSASLSAVVKCWKRLSPLIVS